MTAVQMEHLPIQPRHDAPLWGLLAGCSPREHVDVRVAARDDFGQAWASSNTLLADGTGVLDLAAG